MASSTKKQPAKKAPASAKKTPAPAPAKRAAPAKSAAPAKKAVSAKQKTPAKKSASPRSAAKAAPKKAAPKKAAGAKGSKGAKNASKQDEITIGITPPDLAPGTAAYEFDDAAKTPDTRPKPPALAKAPWLSQQHAFRVGYYLLTHGLSAYGHLELELCNVPGVLLSAASDLLLHLSSYVAEDGGVLSPGESMMVDESPLSVIGFQRIPAGAADTEHEVDVLRVVFLR